MSVTMFEKKTRCSAKVVSCRSVVRIRRSCQCYKVFCEHWRRLSPSLDIFSWFLQLQQARSQRVHWVQMNPSLRRTILTLCMLVFDLYCSTNNDLAKLVGTMTIFTIVHVSMATVFTTSGTHNSCTFTLFQNSHTSHALLCKPSFMNVCLRLGARA